MNKKSYIFCIVSFIFIFVCAYSIGYNIGSDAKISTKTNVRDGNDTNIEVKGEVKNEYFENYSNKESNDSVNGYWMKIKDEYIYIYNSKGELLTNTEISINNLSNSECEMLKDGIYVENAEILFRHLESYTS